MPKRRADWLVGRSTAKRVAAAALAEVALSGVSPAAIEIATEPGGRPYARVAPEGEPIGAFAPGARLPIALSISHAEGHAACAALPLDAAAHPPPETVGIDLGWIEPRSTAFVATFLTEDERRFVGDGTSAAGALRANLVWCAKEAVLKALGVGLTVDTHAVRCALEQGSVGPVEWPIHPAGVPWHPLAATCDPARFPAAGTIRGAWCSLSGFVVALAVARGPEAGARTVALGHEARIARGSAGTPST